MTTRNAIKKPGVTEESLRRLVEAFYSKVRRDPIIGPVFDKAIDDWPEHLVKLQAFWSSVMLKTGRYKGKPLPAHIKHGTDIDEAAFQRWLNLWAETTDELLDPPSAAALQEKADRIAESLMLGIRFSLHSGAALEPRRNAGVRPPSREPAPALPAGLGAYKRTPEFTEATVPSGLLRDHSTKDGVWAMIHVLQGELLFCIEDRRRARHEYRITAGSPGIVEPGVIHRVEAQGPVRFYVEFFR